MNKLFPIVLALIFFGCKTTAAHIVKDVIKPMDGSVIISENGIDNSNSNTIFVYISDKNLISVDNVEVDSIDFKSIIEKKMINNPKAIVSIKADSKALMSTISNIHRWLKDVKGLKLSYQALNE